MNSTTHRVCRQGFTLLELAIVMMVLGLSATMLISGLLKARAKLRRSQCERNQAKIMRGVLEYESNYGAFPPGRLFPDVAEANGQIRSGYTTYGGFQQTESWSTGFYSVHVWILPYVGARNVFELIDFDRAQAKRMTIGGTPHNINFEAYNQPMPLFLCPSDPNTGRGITENNYRVNFGGSTPAAGVRGVGREGRLFPPRSRDFYHEGGNGAFTIGETGLELAEFEDGLTQTVFFSERIKGSGIKTFEEFPTRAEIVGGLGGTSPVEPVDEALERCSKIEPVVIGFNFSSAGRWLEGSDWSNGWPFAGYDSTQYNHVALPNWDRYDCGFRSAIPDTPGEHAIIAARSFHPNSVYVANVA